MVITTWPGGCGQYHRFCLLLKSKCQISSNTNYLQENIKELKAFEIKLATSIVESKVKSNRASLTTWTLCWRDRYYYLQKKKKKKSNIHSLELKSSDYSLKKYIPLCNRRNRVFSLSILPRLLLMKCSAYSRWWRFQKDIKHFNNSVTKNSQKDKMKLQNFFWKVKFMCFY